MSQQPTVARNSGRAIVVLGIAQILGWGTTYSLPAILVEPISRDLSISSAMVFGGISVMLLVNAALAPSIGAWIDRVGASRVLRIGSLSAAAGLSALALSQGPLTYLLAWAILGFTMATALSTPAYAALVEIGGRGARRDIATLTMFTGFSSTISWPVMLWLLGYLDWRGIVWLFAGLHIVVGLPLIAFLLPKRSPVDGGDLFGPAAATVGEALPKAYERRAFWLVALAFASAGFVGWGLALQLPELFKTLGLDPVTAIWIAAMAGPVQVAARGLDMILMRRTRALGTTLLAMSMLPASLVVLILTAWVAGGTTQAVIAGALVFIAFWGCANGLMTVARAALPLELFDVASYGAWMGRLAVLQNIAFAIAPVVLAGVLQRGGLIAALAVALVFALIALSAMLVLARLVASAGAAERTGDAR